MKIVTLTLNPAFDTHCSLDKLRLHSECFAKITVTDAGGKGVNISRALTENGVENLAVVITGKENGALFLSKLKAEGLKVSSIEAEGRIRENITVHEKDGEETRISFEGFCCEKGILSKVEAAVGEVDKDTVITLTGSNPVGLTAEDVTELLTKWKALGAKIVIDSRSFTPKALSDFRPWLIKPNKGEAAAFAGKPVQTTEDAVAAAVDFHKKGIENVIISLGGEGAVLACADGVFVATAPKLKALSTIGAGDSMIAGFIAAKTKGMNTEFALAQAIAYGSAACLVQGTNPPMPQDIEKIKEKVTVIKKGNGF